eukprot:COSAG05_NODE_1791_length_4082_cov_9.583229_2_plen_174_part_00
MARMHCIRLHCIAVLQLPSPPTHRPIASDLLEFSSMCARHAQSACHQSMCTLVLVCVFSVNFQNSEFRICIPLYMCIFSQFSEFRIQNMHSTLYVYSRSIFRIQNSEYAFHSICVFSVNFQNSEFRICIPLYMCIFSRFFRTASSSSGFLVCMHFLDQRFLTDIKFCPLEFFD